MKLLIEFKGELEEKINQLKGRVSNTPTGVVRVLVKEALDRRKFEEEEKRKS